MPTLPRDVESVPIAEVKHRFAGERQRLVDRLFPQGIPRLWCPPLTHYADDGTLDRERMRAHLAFMQPWVRGFLVPGSTGEGWEMSEAEVRELVELVIGELGQRGGQLLIGVLKTTAREVRESVEGLLAWLQQRSGTRDPLQAMARSSVCGFTVCAPTGSALSQEEIREALASVLASDLPVALYQLPQVTQNEIAPGTASALAERFPGFYLFKDSSGHDRVADSTFRGAFLVRGAEGDYARHLVAAGGRYDGFLLSTANGFARPLAEMIRHVERGEGQLAEAFSAGLTALCRETFERAGKVGYGNAFTNANKAFDHFFAHGRGAATIAPPRLHSGQRLPPALVEAAGEALARHGFLPRRGYLEGSSGRPPPPGR